MITVKVTSSIDLTSDLQKLINSTGNVPVEYVFSDDITIDSLVRFYNYTKITGNDITLTLDEDVDPKVFGVHVPFIGSKYTQGATNLDFSGFIIDGNRDHQELIPDWQGHSGHDGAKNWGEGYCDALGFYNLSNSVFHDIEIKDTLGDGFRLDNFKPSGQCGSSLEFYNIKSSRLGHDMFHFRRCNKVNVHDNYCKMDVGNVIRVRNSTIVNFYNNDCEGTGTDFGPAVQLENTDSGAVSSNINIYNNTIKNTLGPGIFCIGGDSTTSTNNINLHNNLIVNCGLMPAGQSNVHDLGGIAACGYNLSIFNNTIDSCQQHGIVFGSYVGTSTIPCTAKIYKNIITNTKVCNAYKGTANGAAIANLLPYTVTLDQNDIYGNPFTYYKCSSTTDISLDPEFVGNGDYHLQSIYGHYTPNGYVKDSNLSPCIFSNYEIGRYSGTPEASRYFLPDPNSLVGKSDALIILCQSNEQANQLLQAIKGTGLIDTETCVIYNPNA